MSALKTITDLMSETEVYKRFPNIFADKELREARQAGDIEWYNLRKGPHYSEDQLIAYLNKRLRKPCQNRPLAPENPQQPETHAPGSSKTSGSGKRRGRPISIVTGMPPMENDDVLIARALEQTT